MNAGRHIFLSPARIALIYALFAGLWILFSDHAIELWVTDSHTLIQVSMAKGWFFVTVTAMLLYALIDRLVTVLLARDMELQRQQEEKLRALQMLDMLAETSEDAIFVKDLEGRYLLFNRAASQFVGKPPELVLGRDDRAIFPPAEAEMLMGNGRRIMTENRTQTTEETLTTPSGIKTFLATRGPLRDASGQIIGIFGISRDITAAKAARNTLEQERGMLKTVIQTIPDLVWLKDPHGIYLACNPAFERFFGAPEADIVGHSDYDFVAWELADYFRTNDHAAIQAGGPRLSEEWITLAAEGRRILVEMVKMPMYSSDGRLLGVLGIAHDVTERRQTETRLRESENRFRDIVGKMPVAYQSLDKEGRYAEVNPALCDLLGYEAPELLEHSFGDSWPLATQPSYPIWFARMLDTGHIQSELELLTRNGRILQVLLRGSIQTDSRGAFQCAHCVLFDITERKQTEQAMLAAQTEATRLLKEADHSRQVLLNVLEDEHKAKSIARTLSDRLQNYLSVSPVVTYALTVEGGRISSTWVSENISKLLGYSLEETLAENWWQSHLHPDDRDAALANAPILFNEGRLSLEYRFFRKNGSMLWVHDEQRLVRDDEGNPLQIVGAWNDITERKQAEEQALRWQRVFEVAQFGLAYANTADNTFTEVNETFARQRGYTPDELKGQPVPLIYAPQEREVLKQRFRDIDVLGHLVFESIHQRKDGSQFPVLLEVTTIGDTEGRPVSRVVYALDITKRKQAENEIHQLNEALEQRVRQRTAQLENANKELESFSYSISHDLRAPLRAINGFGQILAERHAGQLDEKGRHYLENVITSARHMGALIEDLLHYSRVGRSALRALPVSLEPILSELETERAGRLAETGARFEIAPPLPRPLGDATLIRQILANLIDNALTYRHHDVPTEVKVWARQEFDAVLIHVRDNGIGIAPEYHEKIFEVFQRLHTEEEYPGTGIGLAIARKAARLMGGDVSLQSAPHEGCTFCVRLPAADSRVSKP